MVDALLYAVDHARATRYRQVVGAADGRAAVVTLHRPSNVDDAERLESILGALREIARERAVVFPMHPRTRDRVDRAGVDTGGITVLTPVGYLEMLDLVDAAGVLITDSGGLQVESAALGVPCLTLRDTTEWPETIVCGANRLVFDPALLPDAARGAVRRSSPARPEGWDGQASARVVDALRNRP
jgi:UDP-N-acetylglucosamine 2-epimerase (non-hydrolysing)